MASYSEVFVSVVMIIEGINGGIDSRIGESELGWNPNLLKLAHE